MFIFFNVVNISMQVEKTFKNSEMDVVNELKRSGIKWLRLNFCDPFGFLHQISVNRTEITEDAFKQGLPRLDGSSIKGFKEIYESDMLLKPDPSTFAILPEYFENNHNKGEIMPILPWLRVCLLIFMTVMEGDGIQEIAGI